MSTLERINSSLSIKKIPKTINSYSVTTTNRYLAGDKENNGKLCFLVSYQVFTWFIVHSEARRSYDIWVAYSRGYLTLSSNFEVPKWYLLFPRYDVDVHGMLSIRDRQRSDQFNKVYEYEFFNFVFERYLAKWYDSKIWMRKKFLMRWDERKTTIQMRISGSNV